MAQRVVVSVTDDLDGSDGAESISFGFDGLSYEIDLAPQNAARLGDALQPYIEAARRVRAAGPAAASRRGTRQAPGSDPAAVRAWAASAGITVSGRGRIPASVTRQYEAAHNTA
jgi:hypothetical protein